MELLYFVIIWPFLILSVGLVFVTFGDVLRFAGGGPSFLYSILWIALLIGIVVFLSQPSDSKSQGVKKDIAGKLNHLRMLSVIFSISLLAPIFVRYLIESFHGSLAAVIVGLIIGFALAFWGMFMKHNHMLMISNIAAGGLSILYVYFQLWQLGDLARIIAAATGLIFAVVVSAIKLKDKLK